jgi:hypothetical protein
MELLLERNKNFASAFACFIVHMYWDPNIIAGLFFWEIDVANVICDMLRLLAEGFICWAFM